MLSDLVSTPRVKSRGLQGVRTSRERLPTLRARAITHVHALTVPPPLLFPSELRGLVGLAFDERQVHHGYFPGERDKTERPALKTPFEAGPALHLRGPQRLSALPARRGQGRCGCRGHLRWL